MRVSLTAVAKSGAIALWTQSNGVQSGGSTVDFFTAERSAANRVKLQVWTSGGLMSDDGDGALMDDFSFTPTYASISGTVTLPPNDLKFSISTCFKCTRSPH